LFDLFENGISLIANRFERGNQRVLRRVHKFNSNCSGLPVNLRDNRAQRRHRCVVMFTCTYQAREPCLHLKRSRTIDFQLHLQSLKQANRCGETFRLVSDAAVFDFIGDETSEHNRTKAIEGADSDAASIGVEWEAALAEFA